MGSARRDRALLLAGMMGSGKTSVGRLLAQRLGWEFIDTDERIETQHALSIAEIFAREGEDAFRAAEHAVLRALPDRRAVIALGGGAVVSDENRAVLAHKGTLVWLDAPPERLAERSAAGPERPLLAGLDAAARLERLRELAAARAPAYASAHVRIETGERNPDEVCRCILEALGWEDAA